MACCVHTCVLHFYTCSWKTAVRFLGQGHPRALHVLRGFHQMYREAECLDSRFKKHRDAIGSSIQAQVGKCNTKDISIAHRDKMVSVVSSSGQVRSKSVALLPG